MEWNYSDGMLRMVVRLQAVLRKPSSIVVIAANVSNVTPEPPVCTPLYLRTQHSINL